MSLFSYEFMVRALVAAFLVGLTAPVVGTYLVQRRMSLMGDGIGHLALTGVALGFLLGTAPVLTAVVVAALGAVVIELVRERGRTSGDVALAMMFYGGIAGGVLLIGLSSGTTNANLLSYLFGSLLTTTWADVVLISVLAAGVLTVGLGLRPWLYAVCADEEHARVQGLPVRALNLLLAVMAAVTVTVAMRAVGLLLVSALMVVPVATAQQLARSFLATMLGAIALGTASAVTGTLGAYYLDVAPGASIVVLALAVFAVVAGATALRRRGGRAGRSPGPDDADDDLPGLEVELAPSPGPRGR